MENKTKIIIKNAMIAAVYAALTISLEPISYGQIQLRLSELLVLMVIIEKKYIYGLVIGCAIANFLGPFGIVDVIFGTSATLIALTGIILIINKFGISTPAIIAASIVPAIINGIIIALELNLMLKLPLLITGLYVALGELIVVTLIGVPVFKTIYKNYRFTELVKI